MITMSNCRLIIVIYTWYYWHLCPVVESFYIACLNNWFGVIMYSQDEII